MNDGAEDGVSTPWLLHFGHFFFSLMILFHAVFRHGRWYYVSSICIAGVGVFELRISISVYTRRAWYDDDRKRNA